MVFCKGASIEQFGRSVRSNSQRYSCSFSLKSFKTEGSARPWFSGKHNPKNFTDFTQHYARRNYKWRKRTSQLSSKKDQNKAVSTGKLLWCKRNKTATYQHMPGFYSNGLQLRVCVFFNTTVLCNSPSDFYVFKLETSRG